MRRVRQRRDATGALTQVPGYAEAATRPPPCQDELKREVKTTNERVGISIDEYRGWDQHEPRCLRRCKNPDREPKGIHFRCVSPDREQ